MNFLSWFGVVLLILGGGGLALLLAARVGVLRATMGGLVAQGIASLGVFVAIGLWAPDAIAYDEMGQALADFWSGGPSPDKQIGDGKEGFPMVLGALYYVFGHAPELGLALNLVAHGLLIPTVGATARRVGASSRWAAWGVGIFPPILFWGGLLLRESITWFLLGAVAYGLVAASHRVTWRDSLILLSSLAALLWFRGTAAIIVVGVGVTVLVLTASRRTLASRLVVAVLALAVLMPRMTDILDAYVSVELGPTATDSSTAAPPPNGPASSDSSQDGGAGISVDRITRSRESLTENANSSFTAHLPEGYDVGLAEQSLRVVLGPLPWEWARLGVLFSADAMAWYCVLFLSGLGLWRIQERRRALILLLPAFALLFALVATSGNYGTMQRLRLQTTVLLIPVAAAALPPLASERGRQPGIPTSVADSAA